MSFDAQSFLDSTFQGANDTVIKPCPQGEFAAIIDKLSPRQWQSKDGLKTGISLDITWLIEDSNVKAELDRETVSVKQSLFLDSNESGGLDMGQGKNVALGRLREAVGKNTPGEPFAFNMLPGLMAKVKVGHRQHKDDPSIVFAEVQAVAKL